MGETVGKLRKQGNGHFHFWCPACESAHWFRTGYAAGPNWQFDGNFDKPTVTPSINVGPYTPEARCHSFMTAGVLHYQVDCWHEYKGLSLPMVDWDPEETP